MSHDIRSPKSDISSKIGDDTDVSKSLNSSPTLPFAIEGNVYILMVPETELDGSFPTGQFLMKGFIAPYRLDRNGLDGGILVYNREDIPSKLLAIDLSNRGFSVEINLRKKKWVFCLSYNPQKSFITAHMENNGKVTHSLPRIKILSSLVTSMLLNLTTQQKTSLISTVLKT